MRNTLTHIYQNARGERIPDALDKETKWVNIKAYLLGEFNKLPHRQASESRKIVYRFVLSQNGLRYYVGRHRELR